MSIYNFILNRWSFNYQYDNWLGSTFLKILRPSAKLWNFIKTIKDSSNFSMRIEECEYLQFG